MYSISFCLTLYLLYMANINTEADELITKYVENYPDDFYERLLLGPMSNIYSARLQTIYSDWMVYSNLLVDKFAIHSLSFFHLSQGIVERRNDNTIKKSKGYDVFSVNATTLKIEAQKKQLLHEKFELIVNGNQAKIFSNLGVWILKNDYHALPAIAV